MQFTTAFKQKQPPQVVQDMVDRINAGGHARCPSCYTWADRKKVGMAAIFVHPSLPEPLAYIVCKRCTRRAVKSDKYAQAMADRISVYLLDQEGGGNE